jgi:hypothetical protein
MTRVAVSSQYEKVKKEQKKDKKESQQDKTPTSAKTTPVDKKKVKPTLPITQVGSQPATPTPMVSPSIAIGHAPTLISPSINVPHLNLNQPPSPFNRNNNINLNNNINPVNPGTEGIKYNLSLPQNIQANLLGSLNSPLHINNKENNADSMVVQRPTENVIQAMVQEPSEKKD